MLTYSHTSMLLRRCALCSERLIFLKKQSIHFLVARMLTYSHVLLRPTGGDYLRDSFWEMCDEMGILVWLEFQFATALYPRDSVFVDNVVAEVQHQARRLTGHPCTWSLQLDIVYFHDFYQLPAIDQQPSLEYANFIWELLYIYC